MFKAFNHITSDAAIATRHLLSGVFLLSGFNVCIAAGALVATSVVKGTGAAIDTFFTIMNYSSVEIVSPIPEMIAAFNWTTLGAVGIFAAYSVGLYVTGAATRKELPGKVIKFPSKPSAEVVEHKAVANG